MDVEHAQPQPTLHSLMVTCEVEEVDRALAAAGRKVLKGARLPGFRPGHLPAALGRRHFGAQIAEAAREALVEEMGGRALKGAELAIVGQGRLVQVGQLSPGALFVFTIEVETEPKIPELDIGTLSARQQLPERPGEAALAARLAALAQDAAQLEPVAGRSEVAAGDTVVANLRIYDGHRRIAELDREHLLLDTQDPQLQGDLKRALVGQSVPGHLEVELTLDPSLPNRQLAGRRVRAAVQLLELKIAQVPAIDDALAEDLGHASLAALEDKLREELAREHADKVAQGRRQAALEALVARYPLDLPRTLVEAERAELHGEVGLAEGAALAPEVEQRLAEVVRNKVSARLLLVGLARQLDLEPSEAEVGDAVSASLRAADDDGADARRQHIAQLASAEGQRALVATIMQRKALDALVRSCHIVETGPPGEPSPPKETPA